MTPDIDARVQELLKEILLTSIVECAECGASTSGSALEEDGSLRCGVCWKVTPEPDISPNSITMEAVIRRLLTVQAAQQQEMEQLIAEWREAAKMWDEVFEKNNYAGCADKLEALLASVSPQEKGKEQGR